MTNQPVDPRTGRSSRRVRDENGTEWLIREVVPNEAVGGEPTLLFVSRTRQHHVEDFPADWRTRSDAALVALIPGSG